MRATEQSTPNFLIIEGGHNSGKTKELLNLMQQESSNCYATNCVAIMLSSQAPITEMVKAFESRLPELFGTEKKSATEKRDLIPELMSYVHVLVIDDAEKLTGRKLAIVRHWIDKFLQLRTEEAKLFISTKSVNAIDPTLREILLQHNPTIRKRKTDVSYDATHVIIALAALICIATGQYHTAALIGALAALFNNNGRRALKDK